MPKLWGELDGAGQLVLGGWWPWFAGPGALANREEEIFEAGRSHYDDSSCRRRALHYSPEFDGLNA